MESVDLHETTAANGNHVDHGWQKVTNPKRQRKTKNKHNAGNGAPTTVMSGVLRSVEQQAEERRSRILEAQRAYGASVVVVEDITVAKKKSGLDDSDDDVGSDQDGVKSDGKPDDEEKKAKQKKPKKPKVTIAEAAAKIDANDLSVYLFELSEEQQEIQMQKFADFYGKAFQQVAAEQLPWLKMFKESTIAKLADIPISHISDAVYKTSVDWISQQSLEVLGFFVLLSLDIILEDLAAQQASAKGSKKGLQQTSAKSKVGILVALAMVLRRKPDAFISVLPKLRETPKYQGQDKLPIFVWMIVQASKGDLPVGMYIWAHHLLPTLGGKNCNPQSRDLILQLVEWILSVSKARSVLVNAAVRKGERLVPPSSFEILMRATFPVASSRLKATERFEAIYPTVKEVALTGVHGSKAMRQMSLQMFNSVVKAAGESSPELSKEASGVVIWCLNQNPECYKQWEKFYSDNLESSVGVLRRLSDEWKDHSVKLTTLDTLKKTVKSFRHKNDKVGDADKYCKNISGKLSRGRECLKALALLIVAAGVGATVVSPNMDNSWDWDELYVIISSQLRV